jgi:hypothetical protein
MEASKLYYPLQDKQLLSFGPLPIKIKKNLIFYNLLIILYMYDKYYCTN